MIRVLRKSFFSIFIFKIKKTQFVLELCKTGTYKKMSLDGQNFFGYKNISYEM